MLRIYIKGPQKQGFLDLPPGAKMQIESLYDIFDEDLSTGEFSLPQDVPWTDNNRMLLGFAERLTNFATRQEFYECTVYDDYVPEIPVAKFRILEKSGAFTYRRGKFSATISGSKSIFGSIIKNKRLRSFYFGGIIAWQDKESRKFAEDVMKGLYPQYDYLGFAPVAIENFYVKDRPDYSDEFLAGDTVNYLIKTGNGIDDWTFNRVNPDNTAAAVANNSPLRVDYQTVPFFKWKWVFKKVFEELGYVVTGDVINSTDFDNLFMFNNYGIENYSHTVYQDFNRSIFPSNHMPDITAVEFIKASLDGLNLFPTFKNDREINLQYRVTNVKEKNVLDISSLAGKDFQSTFEEASTDSNGFKLTMQWDPADGYKSERAKEITEKVLKGSVAKKADLATFLLAEELTTDHIVYVEAENLYYVVADGTSNPRVWDVYTEKLTDYISGNGERNLEVGLSTLCTYIGFNPANSLQERKNYVGTRQPGSYRNKKNVYVLNPFGLRVFYLQKRVIGGTNMPVTYNHNRDDNNAIIEKFSLSWHGIDGLAQLHIAWQNLRTKVEVVKTTIQIDQKVLADLKTFNKVQINGVQFLPYKNIRTIPLESEMEIRIVPL